MRVISLFTPSGEMSCEYWLALPTDFHKDILALSRYAVGSRPADGQVARASPCETPLLITNTERTCRHVSNVLTSKVTPHCLNV